MNRNLCEYFLAQKTKIMALVQMFLDNGFAHFEQGFGRECRGNPRVVVRQPRPQRRLRPPDDRIDIPERIVKVQCYGANAMQSEFHSRNIAALSSYNER